MHGHAGTSASTNGVGTGVTGRTCGGFASYGPASRTHSIQVLDLLQQRPASPAEANICEDNNRGGPQEDAIYIQVKMTDAKSENPFDSKYQK